eukprot:CAMPEP_0201535834 /NCGR_PEP_ID=MMETSP0161_2-20130828/60172_1 /ASSEMBLY_ACC=CAM_ASM_000251 /TAXON_ID=180227 /ORGANISM="Neoparamoeba aestuarina, Strain SoJaBio B1-5/56/2" /LENGTH=154 /DNA_ID=CAMNT_0047941211 /DNA_START=207 /DNA_END=668 /DNA_ORIENTATION=+
MVTHLTSQIFGELDVTHPPEDNIVARKEAEKVVVTEKALEAVQMYFIGGAMHSLSVALYVHVYEQKQLRELWMRITSFTGGSENIPKMKTLFHTIKEANASQREFLELEHRGVAFLFDKATALENLQCSRNIWRDCDMKTLFNKQLPSKMMESF